MRTATRSLALLALLSTVVSSSEALAASPAARIVTREGSTIPWLRVETGATRAAPIAGPFEPEALARRALAKSLPSSLSLVATRTDRFAQGEKIVHFEQTHRGLPVIGRGAAVRLSASGATILTAIDLEESLPASTIPGIAPAAVVARTATVKVGTVAESDAHLVIWPLAGGGSRLAYVVLPRVPAGLPFAPRIVVDAQSGAIIEARDLVRFAKASVYRFNPVKTPSVEDVDLPIAPASANGKLTNDFVTSANCIDRKSVKPVKLGGLDLKLHVCDIDQLATANASGDFVYVPTDIEGAMSSRSDEFSELSMYYHTTKAYEFFRGLQGDRDAQVVVDKPLSVVANLQIPAGISTGNLLGAADPNTPLDTFSNAFFSPAGGGLGAIFAQIYGISGGALWFGQGPRRDYAYDGDVVYHEFTHAVVDHTLKLEAWHVDARGAIDSPGAMNEGLADYFSSAITGDPDVGEYASADIEEGSGVIRTLKNTDRCPSAIIGEVHYDSTLFSGALWDARASLPFEDRARFDGALYKAMRTNPGRGDLGYGDLAALFTTTLGTDLPSGKVALEKALTEHGILPSCERVLELTGKELKAPDRYGFAAPGTQSGSFGAIAPGILQIHATLPAEAVTLVVSFRTRTSSGGGDNPLGGQATPFAPVVLAKYGQPITWKSGAHDASAQVVATGDTTRIASFDLPPGATDVYLQIGNTGESDGAYDHVSLDLGPTSSPPALVAAPIPDSSPPPPLDASSGCAVTAPLPAGSGWAAAAGLGLAAVGLRRRRRG